MHETSTRFRLVTVGEGVGLGCEGGEPQFRGPGELPELLEGSPEPAQGMLRVRLPVWFWWGELPEDPPAEEHEQEERAHGLWLSHLQPLQALQPLHVFEALLDLKPLGVAVEDLGTGYLVR